MKNQGRNEKEREKPTPQQLPLRHAVLARTLQRPGAHVPAAVVAAAQLKHDAVAQLLPVQARRVRRAEMAEMEALCRALLCLLWLRGGKDHVAVGVDFYPAPFPELGMTC